ncbi:MAG: hypothetical protein NTV22_01420, partial [bacterium]|nr:hypothetical protein [bacterium]
AKHMVCVFLARGQVESVMRLVERFGDVVSPTVQELNTAIKNLSTESLIKLSIWERLPAESAKHMVPALLACGQVESVMRLVERFGDVVNPPVQEMNSAINSLSTESLVKLSIWERLPIELAKTVMVKLLVRGSYAECEMLIERFGNDVCPTVQELNVAINNATTENLTKLAIGERLPIELAKMIVTVLLERGKHADAEVLIKRFGGTI